MLGSRVYSGGSGGSVGSGVEVEVIIKEYVASSNKMVAEILELLTNSSQSGNVGSGGSGKENSFSKFFSSKGIKPNNNNTF